MRNRMSGGVRGRRQKPSPTRSDIGFIINIHYYLHFWSKRKSTIIALFILCRNAYKMTAAALIFISVLSESKNRLLNGHDLYYNVHITKLTWR